MLASSSKHHLNEYKLKENLQFIIGEMPLKENKQFHNMKEEGLLCYQICPFPSHSSQAKHKQQKWFYAFKGLHTHLERHLKSMKNSFSC